MALDVQPITGTPARAAARLCNFATGHSDLSAAHRDWLDRVVAPLMKDLPNPWIDILGYASHLGSASFNQRLSFLRCEAVRRRIESYGGNPTFPIEWGKGESESTGGANDNDGYWRAVEVSVFGVRPTPKPPVKFYDRKVRLHFRSTAMPQVPELTALANAQQVYDGVKVLLEFASGLSMGVTADNLIALDGSDQTCAWNLSNDQQLLLDKFGGRTGVGATDVVVYYVNKLADKKLGKLNGCAGHRPGAAALAVSTVASPWTLAHELGHVLGLQHSTDSINIMFTPTNNITAPIPGFTAEQARTVRASPFCAEI